MHLLNIVWHFFLPALVTAWSARDGQIYDAQGDPFHIRGASWFGFETQDFVINGLWSHPMDFYVQTLQDLGVNVLRVPWSAEWILYNQDIYPYDGMVAGDPENQHSTSWEILERLFDKTEKAGIHIMLDLHRLHKEYISEVWYSPTDSLFTSDDFFSAWARVLDTLGDRPNLMAIDLLNEPHGRATWGTGDPSTDWRLFAEQAIGVLEQRYPDHEWLYFVEGIGWGKSLTEAVQFPVLAPDSASDRLVYSPHSYGKSVVASVNPWDVTSLRQDWEVNFGQLREQGATVVVGEWGGRTDMDQEWMDHFVDYLLEKNMTDTFFWSLGPNSGDVAGILMDDWTTVDAFKQSVMKRLG